MKTSIVLKIATIGLLVVILLIPLFMIGRIIEERSARRQAAVDEISSTWGRPQTVLGPILSVPYKTYSTDKDNVERCHLEMAYFLPSSLKMEGTLTPERRWRGIFETVVYRADLNVSGTYSALDPVTLLSIPAENIVWKDAILSIGISDTRGIRSEIKLDWDGIQHPFRPTTGNTRISHTGIHVPLPALDMKAGTHTFSFTLGLQGADVLRLVPAGMETEAQMKSTWPDPSFEGSFLPESRQIGPGGFTAKWKVAYFGRSYPQQWKSENSTEGAFLQEMQNSSFGTKLFLPANFYTQTNRSVKYAVLFVSLTFLAFALFEILASLRLHPLHYILVGLSLSLFYLLLLSLSEHIGFSRSYLVSAAATTLLISGYCGAILARWNRAAVIAGILAALYGYLYVLLQLEDYALLLGSLALFVILAAVMYLTRKIDWYEISNTPPPAHQKLPPRMPPPFPPLGFENQA